MKTLVDYLAFADEHPELFVNPLHGGFTILLDEEDIQQVEAEMAQKLQARGRPAEWSHVGIVFEDRAGYILRDAVRFPDGSLGTYIRFVSRKAGTPGIIVLPVYQQQILLVRRFRHPTRMWHLEIPLGPGIKGLSPQENARAELQKEIEANTSRLISLGSLDAGPGMNADSAEMFYAEVERYGMASIQEGIQEVIPLSIPAFEQKIKEGEISDSFTIAAYARAKIYGLL